MNAENDTNENDSTYDHEKIKRLKEKIKDAMKNTQDEINKICDPVELFERLKFGKLGFAPVLKTKRENVLEQINQSFTNLMYCYAAEKYFPEAANFSFALANSRGRDMIVFDQKNNVIAEVEIFTAVSAHNNRKLLRDINRLRDAKIAAGCRRVVCYAARSECSIKSMPTDVEVFFCKLDQFINWIRENPQS